MPGPSHVLSVMQRIVLTTQIHNSFRASNVQRDRKIGNLSFCLTVQFPIIVLAILSMLPSSQHLCRIVHHREMCHVNSRCPAHLQVLFIDSQLSGDDRVASRAI